MATKRSTRSKKTSAAAKKGEKAAPQTPPTLVLLVRHGKTPTTGAVLPGRAKGLHLHADGIAQAEAVAERIKALHDARSAPRPARKGEPAETEPHPERGVVAVYASPMERTRETAAPIAKALGQRVRQRAGLIECDFGEWTGRKLSELYKLPEWKTVQRHPSGFRFPKGESFPEMQARMVGTINELVAQHPGQTIVAVSHADTIKAAVAEAIGTPLDLFQRIVIGQCSVSAVLYGPTGPTVLAVNHTGDLVSLVPS